MPTCSTTEGPSRRWRAAAAAALLIASGARADGNWTTQEAIGYCTEFARTADGETAPESPEQALRLGIAIGRCHGFIVGFWEGVPLGVALAKGEDADVRVCMPRDVTLHQQVEHFLGYALPHPDQLDEPAAVTLLLALREAYPCR